MAECATEARSPWSKSSTLGQSTPLATHAKFLHGKHPSVSTAACGRHLHSEGSPKPSTLSPGNPGLHGLRGMHLPLHLTKEALPLGVHLGGTGQATLHDVEAEAIAGLEGRSPTAQGAVREAHVGPAAILTGGQLGNSRRGRAELAFCMSCRTECVLHPPTEEHWWLGETEIGRENVGFGGWALSQLKSRAGISIYQIQRTKEQKCCGAGVRRPFSTLGLAVGGQSHLLQLSACVDLAALKTHLDCVAWMKAHFWTPPTPGIDGRNTLSKRLLGLGAPHVAEGCLEHPPQQPLAQGEGKRFPGANRGIEPTQGGIWAGPQQSQPSAPRGFPNRGRSVILAHAWHAQLHCLWFLGKSVTSWSCPSSTRTGE